VEVHWYNQPVEEGFLNHGEPLGYNLKPNSDEIKALLRFMPAQSLSLNIQYSLSRHGADYGSSQVDGSSYASELAPEGRNDNPALRKYFLKDGAYEWTHTARVGCAYSFEIGGGGGGKVESIKKGISAALFADAGVVFSYWTNIDGPPNRGEKIPYSIIDTHEYPNETGIIFTLGVKLFY
jgi:hypothetical protein